MAEVLIRTGVTGNRELLRFGSRSFCASAPTLWNSLPRSVRFCESLTTFRKHLKTFYFQSAFPGDPIATQRLRFNFWRWRFINSFTYLLTYLLPTLPCMSSRMSLASDRRIFQWEDLSRGSADRCSRYIAVLYCCWRWR